MPLSCEKQCWQEQISSSDLRNRDGAAISFSTSTVIVGSWGVDSLTASLAVSGDSLPSADIFTPLIRTVS